MLLLCNFLSTSFYGQTTSGILIDWNSEVGCQVYGQSDPPRGTKDPIFLEDILDGQCIRVCEYSTIRYTLTGNLGSSPNTVWTVVGGTKYGETSSICNVSWGATGNGSIAFSINTPNGIITKTICIEKIIRPRALFTTLLGPPLASSGHKIPSFGPSRGFVWCTSQIFGFLDATVFFSTPL